MTYAGSPPLRAGRPGREAARRPLCLAHRAPNRTDERGGEGRQRRPDAILAERQHGHRAARLAAVRRSSRPLPHTPLIPAHSRPKDGVLPHAYAGIQRHIRQGQLIGPVWTPTCAERSELRARDPHTKQSLRNLASFRQMGLSERYLRPFPFVVFFKRTPGPPPFSSMNSDRPNRLS